MIAFVPKVGTVKKPYDYRSFQGWAKQFLAYHNQPITQRIIIDNTRPPRWMRAQVIEEIRSRPLSRVVAFFCHGFRAKIQLGPTITTVRPLAEAIAHACVRDVRVVLYACSAGSGPGPSGDRGFADELRDALCEAGAIDCQVDAHVTAGRADANPYARRFDGAGSTTGGEGGYYLVNRTLLDDKGRKIVNPLWGPWVRWLRGDGRWIFPLLSREEIAAELEG